MIIAKPKDFRGTFRKLLRFMRPHWMGMTAIILLAGATTLASSLSPKIMGSATNESVRGASPCWKAAAAWISACWPASSCC